MLFVSAFGFSQALKDGKYKSVLYNNDLTLSYEYTFIVKNGVVDVEGVDTSTFTKKTISRNANTTMTWVNNGGIWTESHTYIFTKDLKTGEVYVHLLRIVQNEGQLPWNVFLAGYVYKVD